MERNNGRALYTQLIKFTRKAFALSLCLQRRMRNDNILLFLLLTGIFLDENFPAGCRINPRPVH